VTEESARKPTSFAKSRAFACCAGQSDRAASLTGHLKEENIAYDKELGAEIEKLFAQHPDHDFFGSLPGAGPKIAPRLLSLPFFFPVGEN
jgi:hypothetical protein